MSDLEWKIEDGRLLVRGGDDKSGDKWWGVATTRQAARILQCVIASTKEQCAREADAVARDKRCHDFEGITKGTAQGIAERIRSLQITGEGK